MPGFFEQWGDSMFPLITGGCGSPSCHLPSVLVFCATEQHFSLICLLLWGCSLISHWCAPSLHAVALSARPCVSLRRGLWKPSRPAARFIHGARWCRPEFSGSFDNLVGRSLATCAASPASTQQAQKTDSDGWAAFASSRRYFTAISTLDCFVQRSEYKFHDNSYTPRCLMRDSHPPPVADARTLPAVVGCELSSHYHQ